MLRETQHAFRYVCYPHHDPYGCDGRHDDDDRHHARRLWPQGIQPPCLRIDSMALLGGWGLIFL